MKLDKISKQICDNFSWHQRYWYDFSRDLKFESFKSSKYCQDIKLLYSAKHASGCSNGVFRRRGIIATIERKKNILRRFREKNIQAIN